MSHIVIFVSSNPDFDDCLAGAEWAYIAEHPVLAGYDLSPAWGDDERETVTLTIPLRPIIAEVERLRERSATLWAAAIDTAGPEYAGGSEERVANLETLAETVDGGYQTILTALETGDLDGIAGEIEQIRRLESEGGDPSTAYDATQVLGAIGIEV